MPLAFSHSHWLEGRAKFRACGSRDSSQRGEIIREIRGESPKDSPKESHLSIGF